MSKTLVLYHHPCSDGFGSAWAAWRGFGDEAEYVPVTLNEPPPDVTGRVTYLCDFSGYDRETIIQMHEDAESFQVLDHHKTAECIADLPYVLLDKTRSGAGITWDFFHGIGTRPKLINYIEDRDLWRHLMPDCHEVFAYSGLVPRTFEGLEEFSADLEDPKAYANIVSIGKAILQVRRKEIDELTKIARMVEFGGHTVPCVNSYLLKSELCHELARDHDTPFAISWHQRANGSYYHSLRSNAKYKFDVEELARQYGGGGHAVAAAFTCEVSPVPGIGN